MGLPSWIGYVFYHTFTSTVCYNFNVCGRGHHSLFKFASLLWRTGGWECLLCLLVPAGGAGREIVREASPR